MRKFVIGVMGGAQVSRQDYDQARQLGELIAEQGWILLNGGRDAGVMRASAEGAKRRGGLTLGILPGPDADEANPFIDIAVATGMGSARNVINVLSSDVIVACRGGAGTISEIALALKSGKTVILLGWSTAPLFAQEAEEGRLVTVETPQACIETIRRMVKRLS
ncbi:MAG: TIGR00725 family protein [candidate division KSB1 bacterium]|nr:TIGR00725 family protein [candidate division KSB1 bacterium]